MTLTPYVKTALAALILPIFYHPSLHVYEPSGKSLLDVAAGPQLRGDLSEVAPNGVDGKGSAAIVSGKGPKARALFSVHRYPGWR